MLRNFRRVRNLKRYRKIVGVLARHGFGSIFVNLQVDRYLPLPPRIFKQSARPPSLTAAEHLRVALEELGPTFIKLGQILSIRPDLFPPQYILELSKLREQAPATPWEEIHALLKKEYGDSLETAFKEIETEPLGSASLAQVHAAFLADGSPVVLKIQRPNIRHTIEADLDILTDLASLAQRTSWGKVYDPIEIVTQFAFTLQNELDYHREGINADRFRKNFRHETHLLIPEIYWDLSTPLVLVMERIEGVRIDHLDELEHQGFDRKQIARHAARIHAPAAPPEAGARLAIDDFGTGYSSLTYLRRFPVDILKIAKDFIEPSSSHRQEWAFTGAILALGKRLGLTVVAEGIEEPAQLERLRAMGCELGQGFLFARPATLSELAAAGRLEARGPVVGQASDLSDPRASAESAA